MKPILLLLLTAFTAQAFEFTGKVVGVSDGDTITALAAGNKQFKIRLLAIDTPEGGQAQAADKDFTAQASYATGCGVHRRDGEEVSHGGLPALEEVQNSDCVGEGAEESHAV